MLQIFQQSSSCHKNLKDKCSGHVENVFHHGIFRFLGHLDDTGDHWAVQEELHGEVILNLPQGLEQGQEVGAGDQVGVDEGKHGEPRLDQGWAATTEEKVLNGANCWGDNAAERADATLVGHIPVPGQGFHPGPARQVPGLDHCLLDLVRGGVTCGEEGMGSGEGHKAGEIVPGLWTPR